MFIKKYESDCEGDVEGTAGVDASGQGFEDLDSLFAGMPMAVAAMTGSFITRQFFNLEEKAVEKKPQTSS